MLEAVQPVFGSVDDVVEAEVEGPRVPPLSPFWLGSLYVSLLLWDLGIFVSMMTTRTQSFQCTWLVAPEWPKRVDLLQSYDTGVRGDSVHLVQRAWVLRPRLF